MESLIPFPARPTQNEWIGGRYTSPHKIRDGDAIIQPEIVLWMELPGDLIVGSAIIDPRVPVPFAMTLEHAMQQPDAGPPRRPSRIRVPDASLAEELRESAARDLDIVVAPVPELDAAFADLSATMGEDMNSYLEGGAIAPAVVATFFQAAEILYRIAPWRQVAEFQVVHADIPRLAVKDACLSIIGGGGESYGLLLFRSIEDYRSFTNAVSAPRQPRPNGRQSLLSVSFDRKKDIPPPMLREIEKHRWPVAGTKAYPAVISVDANMNRLRLSERDYRIATAVTLAFVSFLARHGDVFEGNDPEPICESFTGDDNITVTLTAPHGDAALFDVDGFLEEDAPPPRRAAAGRNDPCPCGSGKKYKKCHLDADTEVKKGVSQDTAAIHEMDNRMVHDIGRFATSRFGDEWIGGEMDATEEMVQLYIPWLSWTADAGGKRVADSFLEHNATRLSIEERDWFAAQKNAWMSIWEVMHVEPGRVDVRDLLTGERRSIREGLASRTLVARDVLLARVVDFGGLSLFGALYGRSLPPPDAEGVLRAIRSKLGISSGPVGVDSLRGFRFGRFMIERWMATVEQLDKRRSTPPALQNTDGDPLLFVTQSFRFKAGSRKEIENRLGAMDDAETVRPGEEESEYVFFRARGSRRKKDRTVVGRVLVTDGMLRIEGNSEERADALSRRVRDACAGLLRRAERTMEKPLERAANAGEIDRAKPPSPEEQALVRQFKEDHYREWLSTPIPALGGKTPRAAARSAKGRGSLDLLLREIENHENRLPEGARFDVRILREALGLDE